MTAPEPDSTHVAPVRAPGALNWDNWTFAGSGAIAKLGPPVLAVGLLAIAAIVLLDD